jgi:hypothetical protein
MQTATELVSHATEPDNNNASVKTLTVWRRVKQAVFSFPIMSFALVSALIFIRSVRNIAESDMWWHLRNAQYLFQAHALPRVDMYSFSAAGSAWLNHEWLSEIPFYVGFHAMGLRGVLAVYYGVLLLIFAGVYYRTCRSSDNCKNAILVSVVGVMLGEVSFGPRTLLFGWLCMTALLLVLDHFRRSGKGLWLVPPLFTLWINLHGSWVFGIVVLVVTIASGTVAGEWERVVARRWSAAELKKLLLTLGASTAALFVNPFGYRLVLYPFDLLFRQTSNMKFIEEWQSVNFSGGPGKLAMVIIGALLVSAWLSSRRWRLDEVLLVAFALWSALSHVRLLFFAGLIMPPILAPHLKLLSAYERKRDKPWLNAVIIASVIGALVYLWPSEANLQRKVNREYPAAALEFMQQEHVSGRIFNSYKFGGYLEWYTPRLKPFIDGRADIFVYNGTFDDYGRVSYLESAIELLDKYNIDYVLYEPKAPLSYLLDHSSEWQVIYTDSVARLYRRIPGGCAN